MPKLTKMSPLAVAVQQKALMLAAAGGKVQVRDRDNTTLAEAPVRKIDLVDNQIRVALEGREVSKRGKAATYCLLTADGQELWGGTVGVNDEVRKFNMQVRTTEFIPGVMFTCDEFTHTMPYESDE